MKKLLKNSNNIDQNQTTKEKILLDKKYDLVISKMEYHQLLDYKQKYNNILKFISKLASTKK